VHGGKGGVEVKKNCTPRTPRGHKKLRLSFLAKTTGSRSGGHPVHTVDPFNAALAICGLDLSDRLSFNARPDPSIKTCQHYKACGSCQRMRGHAEELLARKADAIIAALLGGEVLS
jgi:hypothetical protein